MLMIADVPIPRDIPLPLPGDVGMLQALLVVAFLAHILFINLMLGASVLTLVCEIMGLRRRDYDTLAREIAKTITVNKSLAVVLGVAPLLLVNVLYTVYFYAANVLTGNVWIMIVPLVIVAFLITYIHKYTWERMAQAKGLHIAIGAVGTLIFLSIPLIFLSNINLMLFPAKWTAVRGFVSTLWLPNVLPRYAHFLLGSLAVTGLFLVIYMTRRAYPVEERFETFSRPQLRRGFYNLAFGATALNFIVGPILFFTLPPDGVSWRLMIVIGLGVVLALVAAILMYREILSGDGEIGRRFVPVVALITVTVMCMGFGRHLYREGAVDDHRRLMAQETADYTWAAVAADFRARSGGGGELSPAELGRQTFDTVCAACHMVDRVLVGPPLTEIAEIYAGDPEGIIKWTRDPGKKRAGFPPMPKISLPDKEARGGCGLRLAAWQWGAGAGGGRGCGGRCGDATGW
jgi:cytochrome c